MRETNARPSSSLPTTPYTAGPHELCPTPAAPSRSIASTSASARGWKTPP